jgi:hypothetical protein
VSQFEFSEPEIFRSASAASDTRAVS